MFVPKEMRHLECMVEHTLDPKELNTNRNALVRIRMIVLFLFSCATLLTIAHPLRAATSEICDLAARKAARETGVPIFVLQAITRTETGRGQAGKLTPWPWTVNMEGHGYWFDTESAAKNFVRRHLARGSSSFDVGCFQLNYKWHGSSFGSIDQMFDPFENAFYAARFLKKLFAETGDWSLAAGTYHSRTPEYAQAYRARFDRIYRRQSSGHALRSSDLPAAHNDTLQGETLRTNSYPLLTQVNATYSRGSLVPLGNQGQRAFVDFSNLPEGS